MRKTGIEKLNERNKAIKRGKERKKSPARLPTTFFNPKSKLFRHSIPHCKLNKTGLQHVSSPLERVHYFEGWVEGDKSLRWQGFAYRQTYRTVGGARCIKVSTKLYVL